MMMAPIARRTIRHTMPITLGGPTRCGRHPASRVRTPKSRLKKRRYQGKRTAIASSSALPHRRQKWRTGSLPSPHWPQMRSPGCRRVGGSIVRGAGRVRVIAGATDVGRREIGSSWTAAAGGAAGGGMGAAGAATPASTGGGVGAVVAAVGIGGGAGGAAGAAEVTGTDHTTCGTGSETADGAALTGAWATTGAGAPSWWGAAAG